MVIQLQQLSTVGLKMKELKLHFITHAMLKGALFGHYISKNKNKSLYTISFIFLSRRSLTVVAGMKK